MLNPNSSQAAIVSYSLSGTVDSGPLLNQPYSGTFSFDDSLLTGIGSEFLPVPTVTVDFGGTYTQSDAASPPEVAFLDGDLLGLSFSVNTSNLDFSFVPGFFDVSEAYFTYQTPQGAGAGNIIYAPVTAVPESSSVLGILALGICGLGTLLKRHQP
jgi:hypothetical protein